MFPEDLLAENYNFFRFNVWKKFHESFVTGLHADMFAGHVLAE